MVEGLLYLLDFFCIDQFCNRSSSGNDSRVLSRNSGNSYNAYC